MSEIKVNSIKGVGATNAAITVNNSDGTCTANITNKPNRNLIINGGVTIHQRGGTHTHSGGSTNYYGPDRFFHNCTGNGKTSIQQSTDAPNGFTNSLLITTTTQAATASSDIAYVGQYIEANNMTQLGWGASGAKTATLSFYVKSSLTGNFAVWTAFRDSTASNHFVFTINNANTWERKTITIPALTSGGVASGSGRGVSVQFDTGTGSAKNGTAGTWSLDLNNLTESGTVKLTANAGATLQVTGVQLEVGSVATDFEHRSFAQELALCQRYFHTLEGDDNDFLAIGLSVNAGNHYMIHHFPQPMRINPSYSSTSTNVDLLTADSSSNINANTLAIVGPVTTPNPTLCWLYGNTSNTTTGGQACIWRPNADGLVMSFSAEL
tara:strand:+ start:581 stop:1723 length:1143 start_codon:yes stop_codon:yes gene_type:complete